MTVAAQITFAGKGHPKVVVPIAGSLPLPVFNLRAQIREPWPVDEFDRIERECRTGICF